MKFRAPVRLAAALFVALLAFLVVDAAGPRDDQWKKVTEAVNKGLPKTAIERLQPIIDQAIRDKAYPEAIKAIGLKIALEGNIEGNKPEEKIVRMRAEIAKAPPEMVPAMEALLAHWYWQYFQQNRWRIMQRTQTGESPGGDLLTWDLPRVLAEIDKQFAKALSHDKELKATPVATYDALLVKGTLPDSYRPTLYDFIANDALSFYSTPEQAGAKAEDAFELKATQPIFAPAAEFRKWEIASPDVDSRLIKAIKIYQQLLQFHEKDADRSAYLDADLARLSFGYAEATGDEKNAVYKAALKRFADANFKLELSARALFRQASIFRTEGDLVEARKIAIEGEKAFPNSIGGKLCFNLIQEIEAKSSNVVAERVWNQPWPGLEVHYRNVTQMHFRIVRADFQDRMRKCNYRPEYLMNDGERKALLTAKPEHEWSATLPPTEDFQERTQTVAVPKDVKPGFYWLIASHNQDFADKNNPVVFSDFWVSELALVMRIRNGEGLIEGFVLQAGSGDPIAAADVQIWQRDRNNRFRPEQKTKTDKNGLFSLTAKSDFGYVVEVNHNGQQLASGNDYNAYAHDQRAQPYTQAVYFTDRAIYRPGQTISFKGLLIKVDVNNDNYTTVPNQAVTVIFQDPNGKEVARQSSRSNEFGSFSGSFTAPRDRLMGQMMIRSEGEPNGAVTFNVEEYKRPKFQVELEAPKTPAKLNAQVQLNGKATAYTGAAIGGAKVRYRVVRETRYPDWYGCFYWWRPVPSVPAQEIAHSNAISEADGSFPIQFLAKPDPTVPEKDEPVFRYTVYADVTDTTGETSSAQRTIKVAYTALQAKLTAQEWQTDAKDVDITVRTTTIDGEAQAAKTQLKIFAVKQPEKVERASLQGVNYYQPRLHRGGDAAPEADPSKPDSWPLGAQVAAKDVATDATGKAVVSFKLPAGMFRVMLETEDRFGKKVTARLPVTVLKPAAKELGLKVPYVVSSPTWTLEPGEEFSALWGSGYDKARAYVEIEHRRKVIQSFWTDAAATQQMVKQAVTESMRGGFTVRVTMVRDNRAYLTARHVEVPWTNKNLTVKWEHFVSKLEPGRKETFTAVITGPGAKRAVAEMVATLYDASLDQYRANNWLERFNVFRVDQSNEYSQFENMLKQFQYLQGQWPHKQKAVQATYRRFPADLTDNLWGYEYYGRSGAMGGRGERALYSVLTAESDAAAVMQSGQQLGSIAEGLAKGDGLRERNGAPGEPAEQPPQAPPPAGFDPAQVAARKNLNETAFFFPHLVSDQEGVVKLVFTMPEALTQWKFLGFAHDKELRAGLLEDKVVTAKDLMVQPNPPRFVREGDVLEFTVKVSNQSEQPQRGAVRLTFADARTGKPVDDLLKLAPAVVGPSAGDEKNQSFDIAPKESRTFAWKIHVPDGIGPMTYKAVGGNDKLSDGEEGYLPALSRYVLVTESIPLPIRGIQNKTFDFVKLRESGNSPTLHSQSLTVQMASQPAWYAVMALPYLMEYPYECAEQQFNRLYANSLARHIANSDPKIRQVFNQWQGTTALDSPLEKNQDLKSVMLEETPWLRQAVKESEARKNVGILFDENRLNTETARLLQKLSEMQAPNGLWSWFPGGRGNEYITLYIATGFGRLRHLGVKTDVTPALKSLAALDAWINHIYHEIQRQGHPEKNHVSQLIALYLYGRSFYLNDVPVNDGHKAGVDYFIGQAKKYWLELADRQSQAHLALALKRWGDKETPRGIMASIKERSVSNEEMGRFWRDTELSQWWYRAPIETQAVMIEAFAEVMEDSVAVEDCKVWLLKQKQTRDWKTTKATADAIYGLLLRGENLLKSDALVEVDLGDVKVEPTKVEAGTGFYEQRFVRGEIKPSMGTITLKKSDEGVAWGSVHWQYLEDVSRVTAHEATPLKLNKTLWLRKFTNKGPVLEPVRGPIQVGDEVVVRVELRTDRDMEYVHLKDARGSGTEPVNVLSRYKYRDGLAYYETTRDTASHFFIDYMPKGTYVFEYSIRAVHKGAYPTGMAEIQCMYAPEFNSHSESIPLLVQ
jgi:hypothetical protein